MNKKTYNAVCALLFLGFGVFEAVHDLAGIPWPGLFRATNIVGLLHVPFWLAAGVGLLLRNSWGWIAALLSIMSMLAHGIGINMADSKQGNAFLLAGIAALVLLGYAKPWALEQEQRQPRHEDQRRAA